MKTEDIEYNGQIYSLKAMIDISSMVQIISQLAKRQKYLEDKLNFHEERINDKDKRISELEILIKGISLSKEEKFPSDKEIISTKEEKKNELDDDLDAFLNLDNKIRDDNKNFKDIKEETKDDNILIDQKPEEKAEEEKPEEKVIKKHEEKVIEKQEEKIIEKPEEKIEEKPVVKVMEKPEEKVEEKSKEKVVDKHEEKFEENKGNKNEVIKKEDDNENRININFQQKQTPTIVGKNNNLSMNSQNIQISNSIEPKEEAKINSTPTNTNANTNQKQNSNQNQNSNPLNEEILRKIIQKIKVLDSKIDELQRKELTVKPQDPSSEKTNKLDDKINTLNNNLQKIEEEKKQMKIDLDKVIEKTNDLDVFNLLKKTGDSNIDAAQGLIMNLENKILKKLETYDLRLKKDEEDTFQNKNDIKNMNNMINVLKDLCNKNTKSLKDLKNKEEDNHVEISQFINEINNKMNTLGSKVNRNRLSRAIIRTNTTIIKNENKNVDTNNNKDINNNINNLDDNIINNINNNNINKYSNRISTNKKINTNDKTNDNEIRNNRVNNKNDNNNDNDITNESYDDETIIEKIVELESKINELQYDIEILKLSNSNNNNSPHDAFSQEQLKILKDISSRTNDLEKKMSDILGELNTKELKNRLDTLENNLEKKGNKFEVGELREKLNALDETEKDLHFKVEQLQKFMEKMRADQQHIIKKMEFFSGELIRISNPSSDSDRGKGSILDSTRFVDMNLFNEKQKEMNNKFDKVRLSFEEIARNMEVFSQQLSHFPTNKDFSQFQSLVKAMIEDIKINMNKKYAEKNETLKSIKLLETQIKSIQESLQKKMDGSDSWLLAKKPLNNYVCASCESIIKGELDKKSEFVPWNKYPNREDKSYRYGQGYSRMIQLLYDERNKDLKERDSMSDGGSDSEQNLKLPKLKKLHINSGKLKKNNNIIMSYDENNMPSNKNGPYNNEFDSIIEGERPKIMKIFKRNRNVPQSSHLNRLDINKDKNNYNNLNAKTIPNNVKEGNLNIQTDINVKSQNE